MLGLNVLGTWPTIPMSISTKIISAARSEIIPGYCGKDLDAMLDRQSLEAIRPNVRNWYGKSTPSCVGLGAAGDLRPAGHDLLATAGERPDYDTTNSRYNSWRCGAIRLER